MFARAFVIKKAGEVVAEAAIWRTHYHVAHRSNSILCEASHLEHRNSERDLNYRIICTYRVVSRCPPADC